VSIRTACAACRKVIDVPDHFAGRSGRCKRCGAELVIPGGAKGIGPVVPIPTATRPLTKPSAVFVAKDGGDVVSVQPINLSSEIQLSPPPIQTGRGRLLRRSLLWVGVPLCMVTIAGIWTVLRLEGAGPSKVALPGQKVARREAPKPQPKVKAQPALGRPKAGPPQAVPPANPPLVQQAPPKLAPQRLGRVYLSPASGPESILRMSLDDLDEGQRQVVETLRRREADPERTSFVELWPTGTSGDPTTAIERRHAVVAILRSPNGFGAMVIHRELIYLDESFQITGALGPEFTSVDQYYFGNVRFYYSNVPKSEGEKRNEGMIKGLIDFANQPPVPPRRRIP